MCRLSACPDDVPGRVLRVYTEQLAGMFTDIFSLSLALVDSGPQATENMCAPVSLKINPLDEVWMTFVQLCSKLI